MPHASDIRGSASGATGEPQEGHDLEDNLGVAEVDLRRIFRRAKAPIGPDVDHPHICSGTGLTPMPHLQRDRAHPHAHPRSGAAAETGGAERADRAQWLRWYWRRYYQTLGGIQAGHGIALVQFQQFTRDIKVRTAPVVPAAAWVGRRPARGSSGTRSTLAATYWRQVLANGGLTPEHMDKLFQKSFPPHHSPYRPPRPPEPAAPFRGYSAGTRRPRAARQLGRRAIHHCGFSPRRRRRCATISTEVYVPENPEAEPAKQKKASRGRGRGRGRGH